MVFENYFDEKEKPESFSNGGRTGNCSTCSNFFNFSLRSSKVTLDDKDELEPIDLDDDILIASLRAEGGREDGMGVLRPLEVLLANDDRRLLALLPLFFSCS